MSFERLSETPICMNEVSTGRDRRRFPRMQLDHPVTCEVLGETLIAHARSISGDGMLLETDRFLAEGTVVELTIGPPLTPNRPFRAVMTVVRVERTSVEEEWRFQVAGRFSRVL